MNSHPFTCPKCGGTTGLGHLCVQPTNPRNISEQCKTYAELWSDAYSADRKGRDVSTRIIEALLDSGLDGEKAEWVYRSKHLRWFFDRNDDIEEGGGFHAYDAMMNYLSENTNNVMDDLTGLSTPPTQSLKKSIHHPPTHPGYWWVRHIDPLKGGWQPVLVMLDNVRDNGLIFKKFWWSGHMAVSEAEKLGMEWGPECSPPPPNAETPKKSI